MKDLAEVFVFTANKQNFSTTLAKVSMSLQTGNARYWVLDAVLPSLHFRREVAPPPQGC
jgi:hypothetical protein